MFILRSVEEVERVWSVARNVLSQNRRCMTAQLFEALVLLKYDSRIWNQAIVEDAISNVHADRMLVKFFEHKRLDTEMEGDQINTDNDSVTAHIYSVYKILTKTNDSQDLQKRFKKL